MVENVNPNQFKTESLTDAQVSKLEAALEDQGFQRLQHIPGMPDGHQIPEKLVIYEDKNRRIVVIEHGRSIDGNEVDYTIRSSFLAESVIRNP